MTVSVNEPGFSPTTALVDEKVKELLDDDSLDEFFTSAIYPRPLSVPPLIDVSNKRLSPSEEQELISRLTKPTPPPRLFPDESVVGPRRFMSKKSIQLTQGLESIEKRAVKLARAHQRRIEQLVQQKENEEAENMFGKPRINPTSRRIAEKSSFMDRQIALEERRRILEEEARKTEMEECVFRPKINPKSSAAASRRNATLNNSNVIDRLTRDAEMRQSRKLQVVKDRDESFASYRINSVRRTDFANGPSVFERLYPRSNSLPPPPTSPRATRPTPVAPVIPFSQYMQYDDPFKSVNMSRLLPANSSTSPPPTSRLNKLDLSSIFALTRGRH